MPSALVAGRVDAAVAKKAQFFIEGAGSTQAEVIRYVWQQISETGVVPTADDTEGEARRSLEEEFSELRAITPRSEFLENLSPQDLRRELASRRG